MTNEIPFNLARRLELCSTWRSIRYTEAYQRLHPEAQCATLEVAGGAAVFIKAESPVNRASGMGFNGPVREEDMQALEDFYASRGVPARVHVCPLAEPGLFELVRARGYRLSYFFSVLARAIPPDFRPGPLPGGITVARAAPEESGVWLQASAEGFEEVEEPSPESFDILGPNFSAEDAAAFLAWAEEPGSPRQPAGSGGMYVAPQVRALELGGASTRVAYRRRGVQRALIEARMAEGLRLGCDLTMVLTEPGSPSQRNLERNGFFLAYTKVVMEKAG